ncbi:DUF3634 family protein [Ectothiorhodospiraceae bacterium WFHF3C12]|nr:DUF3634 family protein [Ectothiorhodospiraceae bacterium WFHF3C12]
MYKTRFVVKFKQGRAEVVRGHAPNGFISACNDIARLYGIDDGRVECQTRGSKARLKFSKEIPERAHQPIRNVWTPPTSPTRGGSRARG